MLLILFVSRNNRHMQIILIDGFLVFQWLGIEQELKGG